MLALMGAIHEDEPDARVPAMDMDPQHTITEILATRAESGKDVSWFDVYSLPGAEHLSAKDILALCYEKSGKYDYTLVDTQGAARKEALYLRRQQTWLCSRPNITRPSLGVGRFSITTS